MGRNLTFLFAAAEPNTDSLAQTLAWVLVTWIFPFVAGGAVLWAIWIGVHFAMAEDEGKRKEAKQQLIWSLVAVVASVAVFAIISFAFRSIFITPHENKHTQYQQINYSFHFLLFLFYITKIRHFFYFFYFI